MDITNWLIQFSLVTGRVYRCFDGSCPPLCFAFIHYSILKKISITLMVVTLFVWQDNCNRNLPCNSGTSQSQTKECKICVQSTHWCNPFQKVWQETSSWEWPWQVYMASYHTISIKIPYVMPYHHTIPCYTITIFTIQYT